MMIILIPTATWYHCLLHYHQEKGQLWGREPLYACDFLLLIFLLNVQKPLPPPPCSMCQHCCKLPEEAAERWEHRWQCPPSRWWRRAPATASPTTSLQVTTKSKFNFTWLSHTPQHYMSSFVFGECKANWIHWSKWWWRAKVSPPTSGRSPRQARHDLPGQVNYNNSQLKAKQVKSSDQT